MKIQDIIFLILVLTVIWSKSKKLAVVLGLACLVLAIPLFKYWIFFTAERLTWYAAAFFLIAIGLQLVKQFKS